jgi:mono/diheme cytochrome c family protein
MKKFTLLAAFVLLAVSACAKGKEPAPSASGTAAASGTAGGAEAPSADAVKQAEEIFANRCSPCHGPSGKGDGPASAGLTPKPRNLSDGAWQKEVDDAYLAKIVQYGGAAVGKSAAMPPNPDLNDKPQVIAALRLKIRSLKDK